MSADLDPVRTNLLSAAAMLAGPGASQQAISDKVIALAVMAREGSPVMERLDRVLDAQMFVSTITHIERETSSTRDIVHFRGRPTDEHPEGQEESIRTERTDNPEGVSMSALARSLVGHRVVVYKVFDTIARKGQTQKVRILGWLTDLGLPDGAPAVGAEDTRPRGVASSQAPSRAAYEEPYDPTPPVAPPVVPSKPGPTPEQIREGLQEDSERVVAAPPEPPREDWAPASTALPHIVVPAGRDPHGPADPGSLGGIATNLAALGIKDGPERLDYVGALVGRAIASTKDLTWLESKQVAKYIADERAAARRTAAS